MTKSTKHNKPSMFPEVPFGSRLSIKHNLKIWQNEIRINLVLRISMGKQILPSVKNKIYSTNDGLLANDCSFDQLVDTVSESLAKIGKNIGTDKVNNLDDIYVRANPAELDSEDCYPCNDLENKFLVNVAI